jgi:type I restriction enzyme, S subunit
MIAAENKQLTQYLPYPEYKDSGVEWLGNIPVSWHIKKLKYLAPLVTKKASNRIHPVGLENIESWTGRFLSSDSEFQGEGIEFVNGDILFGKLRPYLAKVMLADSVGEAVGDFHVMRPVDDVIGRYLKYQILTKEFISLVDGSTFGAKMPRVSWEFMADLACVQPSKDEAITIATFLDYETARIDKLIAQQQRLIELLKEKRQAVISHAVTKGLNPDAPMKDSGIEWLGQVPEHWVVRRLKHTAAIHSGIPKGKDLVGKETITVPMLRVANVQDGYLSLDNVHELEIEPHELNRYSLRAGDVLMNEGGDNDKLGRGAVWSGQITPCIHQNHVFAIRVNNIEPEWLSWLTSSSYAKYYFYSVSKQSTNLASISSSNVKETPLVLPPKMERVEIIRYLDEKIEKFARIESLATQKIELLQERRIALISAAVTGKIDLRGWTLPVNKVAA